MNRMGTLEGKHIKTTTQAAAALNQHSASLRRSLTSNTPSDRHCLKERLPISAAPGWCVAAWEEVVVVVVVVGGGGASCV